MLSMSTFLALKPFILRHIILNSYIWHISLLLLKYLWLLCRKCFCLFKFFSKKIVNTCEFWTPVLRTNIERLLIFNRSMIFLMSVHYNWMLGCTMRSRNKNKVKMNFRIQAETKLVFFKVNYVGLNSVQMFSREQGLMWVVRGA